MRKLIWLLVLILVVGLGCGDNQDTEEIDELRSIMELQRSQITAIQELVSVLNLSNRDLSETIENLVKENDLIEKRFELLVDTGDFDVLSEAVENLSSQISDLKPELEKGIESLKDQFNQFVKDNGELDIRVQELTNQFKEVQGNLVVDDKENAKLISLLEDQNQRIDLLAGQIGLRQDNQQVEGKKVLTPDELKKLIQGGWIFDVISQGENMRNQWRFDGDSFTHMLCLYQHADVICALDIGTFNILPNLTNSDAYSIKLNITTKGTADASNPDKLTVLSADETNEQKTIQIGFEGQILIINNIPMQPLPNKPVE